MTSGRHRTAPVTATRRYRAQAFVSACVIAASSIAGVAMAGGTTRVTVKAGADSFISSTHRSANFGHRHSLRVDASPTTRSYVRFAVRGLPAPPTSAVLRLFVTGGNLSGLRVASASSRWSELGISWRTAPATVRSVAATGRLHAGTWVTVDVSKAVRGNGTYTFRLATRGSRAITIASREAGTRTAPRLTMTLQSASPAAPRKPKPTPKPSSTTSSTTSPTGGSTSGSGTGSVSAETIVRGAFYYPWFPDAWNQGGMDPYTHYHPSLGFYDSSVTSVIQQHIAAMQYGGINTGIASWWGQGSRTDTRIPALLSAAAGTGFTWSLYYEPEGQGDPTSSQISSDLSYIANHYATSSSYLHIAGKPVLFVYADANDGCGMADRWKQANTLGFYVVLKVFPGYSTCASQPDGWHQYNPAVHSDSQGSYSYAVSPGFWKATESTPRLARDVSRFSTDVQAMAASNAHFQLVTTFNEWGEGTSVESAQEWATSSGYGSYLDVLHRVLGSVPTPTATATPTTTSAPSPTATTTQTSAPTATPTSTSGSGPCIGASAPTTWSHVIWIVMENHSYADIVGNSAAPYETRLARQCANATAYHAVTHPSLPNYLAMTGGSTFGVTDDNGPSSHPISGASIFSEVAGAGKQWRSYEETMGSNCALSSSGNYAVKHNPAAYYTGIRTDCANWDVPMGTTTNGAFADALANNTLPAFSFVTPNLCNDTHNCSVSTGDTWLSQWLPKVFASPAYQAGRTAVFLTWDEDDNSEGNQVPLLAMAPSIAPGTVVSGTFNHYSLLRTTEDMLGLTTHVGSAASASSMRSALGV